MKKNDDGGTAFPYGQKNFTERYSEGMSMRDYFAAAALQGWLANYPERETPLNPFAATVSAIEETTSEEGGGA